MVRITEGESSSSNGQRSVGRDPERLSAMPQHILPEILSRLSTLDAARVSFGSRILMTTWHSLPTLIFDYSQFPATVNKLGRMTYCEAPIKYQWVEFFIQQNVQKLILNGRICGTQNLAYSIFSCRSLVELELCLHELVLSWSETIELPNLKNLKMRFLLLSEMIISRDLFSNMPTLEKLTMFFCNITFFDVLFVSSTRLKEFMMSNCPGMESCSIKFETPSLSKFIYIGCVPRESVLQVPPCASRLVVDGDDSCTWIGSPDELSQTTPQGRVVNRGGYIEDYKGVGVFGVLNDITIENLGGNGIETTLVRRLPARMPHLHTMKIEMNPHLDDVDVDLKIHHILEY
ncbi:hypothetical protein Salat_2656500 [Sesamum alatum]|uniref:F-box domain-containing protein n=1 Tax=Sesamum alatum TaxID=300844 RepID=A0AAE2CB04_9LAMI|nr:hypothetical protein Salat_2656500 [Sesamum alatum]